MREDDRTGVSETRPDRQYRMPPCPMSMAEQKGTTVAV